MDNLTFGLRLDHLIHINGIRTSYFCEKTGVSQQQLYKWTKTDTVPNALTALRIAKFFNTTVEYLLTGETENPLQKIVDELSERLRKINAVASSI